MEPSGRGCSVTDWRPSEAVETLTTSPVTSVTVFTVGRTDPLRLGAGIGGRAAAAEPVVDTRPTETAATARRAVVRTARTGGQGHAGVLSGAPAGRGDPAEARRAGGPGEPRSQSVDRLR